mgnify:CR=1 FL=1
MLKEIYCELLKTKSRPDGTIHFHNGLNVILGSKVGTTSIGKSTALLIVDFVFGGDTYAKSDAVRELGNHTIYFTFTFNGTDYYFARTTDSSAVIGITDINRKVTSTKTKSEYIEWLAHQYHLDYEGIKFRNTISRFFRIYGKNNYNELRPLQTRGGSEAQKNAIDVLIALFNRYKDVKAFKDQISEADERITAFKNARKYEFIPSAVDGIKKYEENLAVISALKHDKERLEATNNSGVSSNDVEKANELNSLKLQLGDARVRLQQKQSDLHLINLNISQGVYPTEADLKSLSEFFPTANLKKLMDIERFHNKIQHILKEELLEAKAEAEQEIAPFKTLVENFQKQIEAIKPSMAFSQEFLYAYTQLDRKIHKLEDENDAFITRNRLQNEKKLANDRLKEHMRITIHELEVEIQKELTKISDYVSEGIDNYPVIRILEADSYTFETPRNTGTGTNYKGMLFYDLSILKLTNLPAIAHDSLLFPYISDRNLCRLLQLYSEETDKQIFISFDHEENYGKETTELLQKYKVLKLEAEEEALFGKQWGRKDATHENSI